MKINGHEQECHCKSCYTEIETRLCQMERELRDINRQYDLMATCLMEAFDLKCMSIQAVRFAHEKYQAVCGERDKLAAANAKLRESVEEWIREFDTRNDSINTLKRFRAALAEADDSKAVSGLGNETRND